MNSRFHLIVWLAMAVSCAKARSNQYVILGLLENIEAADRIVIGKLEHDSTGRFLRVTETLKGESVEVIHGNFQQIEGSQFEPEVFYMESKIAESVPGSGFRRPTYLARYSHEWNILHMLNDPALFLDQTKYLPDVDRITMLGYLFEGYDMQCPEIPGLFSVRNREHQKSLPWHLEDTLEFKFQVKQDKYHRPKLIANDTGDHDETWRITFRHVMESPKRWETFRGTIPTEITVRVNGRLVPKVGTLTYQAARDFLVAQIRSEDLKIAKAAVMSLARMRDFESVPAVIGLLNDGREELVMAAVDFLEWARDRRAVLPLRAMLVRKVLDLPRTQILCSRVAYTLQSLGDVSALPELVLAEQSGVATGGYAIGAWGSAETIGQILASERKTLSPGAHFAMFSLVRRSNIPREQWPIGSYQITTSTLTAPQVEAWRQWWNSHREGFQIVMNTTQFDAMHSREREEAIAKWEDDDARRKSVSERVAEPRRSALFVVILGMFALGLLMIRRRMISASK